VTETVYINWLLLLAHFLWMLGAAVIVALVSVKVFQGLKKSMAKVGVWLGVGLVLIGLVLLLFKIPSPDLVVVKLECSSAQPANMEDTQVFLPQGLKMDPANKSHPINGKEMKDNTMVLLWDGYIRTPFFRFAEGGYAVGFNARGTRAKGAFAKIKVEFESPDENGYLVVRKRLYIELSGKMKPYRMAFNIVKETVGRVQITYFNDVHIEGTYKGRDVFIKDVAIHGDNNVQ
jgi:hypothetical protein